jgi:hypothetical protein|tara:strand:+ start:96 stop:494 length:399 start_codon:yes stop_codon:yes gene_type:complete
MANIEDLTRMTGIPGAVTRPVKKEKGVIKPSVDLYQDEVETTIGPKIAITTKKGTDISLGITKSKYKGFEDPPSKVDFNIGKEGDKYSYGVTGTKQGKQKSITIGGKIKYSSGGLARGMGAAIQGGKFEGVK